MSTTGLRTSSVSQSTFNWMVVVGPLGKNGEAGYFSAMRDMLRRDGIVIPITTCPGSQ